MGLRDGLHNMAKDKMSPPVENRNGGRVTTASYYTDRVTKVRSTLLKSPIILREFCKY
jgi:hypothetical protein